MTKKRSIVAKKRLVARIKLGCYIKRLFAAYRYKKHSMTMMSGQRVLIKFIRETLIEKMKLMGGIYRITKNKMRHSSTLTTMTFHEIAK